MSSVNKVILIGRLGADPELRHTNAATPVCHLSLATSRRWTDQEGAKQEETIWHRVVVWGKQGEVCNQFLSKGRQVYVEGRLNSRQYTDKDGQNRHATEIISDNVVFLARGAGHGDDGPPGPTSAGMAAEDNLPF